MDEQENTTEAETKATAALEILTGPARGTASWLSGDAIEVSLNDADMIRVADAGSEPLQDGVVARLSRPRLPRDSCRRLSGSALPARRSPAC